MRPLAGVCSRLKNSRRPNTVRRSAESRREALAAAARRVDLELARETQRKNYAQLTPVLVGYILIDGRCHSLAPPEQRTRPILPLPAHQARAADGTSEFR